MRTTFDFLLNTKSSRWIALERLYWVTGYDRCKTRDSRVLWVKK